MVAGGAASRALRGHRGRGAGPFRADVELRYQPIGFRWAENLKEYRSFETDRFTRYFDEMSEGSATLLARSTRDIR